MRERKKKIFCNGNICKIWNRLKSQCIFCNCYLCGVCKMIFRDKIYCINCFLKDVGVMKAVKLEFEDMIFQLNELKLKKKKTKKSGVVVNA